MEYVPHSLHQLIQMHSKENTTMPKEDMHTGMVMEMVIEMVIERVKVMVLVMVREW